MRENTLPRVLTPKEISEYLKVDEDIILHEFETGSLNGFKVGKEWRCSDEDLLTYMWGERARLELPKSQLVKAVAQESGWNIVDSEPFDFNWPKTGGGGYPEHYDKAYEATTMINGQEYTFKIGFGNRKSAGQMRRRVTIWLGNRAVVEFAGSNDYENDGLLAGIIRLRNGKQLTTQRIPDEYRGFRVEKYNSVVQGPRASTGMAVIAHKDDLKSMMEHAIIRATWKELI
jgi:excisionase family DNA binding protein